MEAAQTVEPGAPAAWILLLVPGVAKETFAALRERPLQEGSGHSGFWRITAICICDIYLILYVFQGA